MIQQTGVGADIYDLVKRLYPICRSITGDGVRKTLSIVKEYIPVKIHEVPTGTEVFDWTVPREWNIRDAWVKDPSGKKIIDFKECNLHVLNYSIPVDKKVSLEELNGHLYTLPEQPDLIPYRTSYYNENWGFCLKHRPFKKLQKGEYRVFIDSTLEPGSLTYGELFIKGNTKDEILISCHICHPSLCNDNLSGISVAVHLAKELLSKKNPRYSYRFLFIPGTIGSITWLALNEKKAGNIKHGLVLSCIGDPGHVTWKKTRDGETEIDRVVQKVLSESEDQYDIRDFTPYGYDERQFNSPGFNLPVGCFMRTPFGEFPEYHTSADNLDLVKPHALEDSYNKIADIFNLLEGNQTYLNLNPKCEPQLGKRGLYGKTGGSQQSGDYQMAILWVLNFSDGKHSLLDISEKADMSFELIQTAAIALLKAGLLKEVEG